MSDTVISIIGAISSFAAAGVALYIAIRKTPTEIVKTKAESHKTEAEADNIHALVADRWAEHVIELQNQVKGLALDVAQVRRENEMYRIELAERDQVIADLKDWAERLLRQLRQHAPHVTPESYISRRKESASSHHSSDAIADTG